MQHHHEHIVHYGPAASDRTMLMQSIPHAFLFPVSYPLGYCINLLSNTTFLQARNIFHNPFHHYEKD